MDADSFVIAAVLLLNWRALICFAIAAAIAWALVFLLEILSGPQGIFFALVGWFVGAIWQEGGFQPSPPKDVDSGTRPSIAAIAAFVCGLIWGFVSMSTAKSLAVGAAILFVFLALNNRYQVPRKIISRERSKLLLCATLIGYVTPSAWRAISHISF